MNKTKKMLRKMALLLACGGGLLIAAAIVFFLTKGRFAEFPRPDLAPVGFTIAGVIYVIGAAGVYLVTQDQSALTEEHDERAKTIEAKSGMIGFGVQTLLLFTGIILLIFTGYLNVVSAFCLLAVHIVSVLVFVGARIYFNSVL